MDNFPQIAILDDYQNVSQSFADWSALKQKAHITVFNDHLSDEAALIDRLKPFQVLCVMRERTPLTRNILSRLPQLKLIVSTGHRNASIDMKAAAELGITVMPTGYDSIGAEEMTWALIMALARHIVPENASLRAGGWQTTVGVDLRDKTIGIIGLGNIGSKIAAYARGFGMRVITWSENLTAEKAEQQGAGLVTKETVFKKSDSIT